jgi:hypothetical protein
MFVELTFHGKEINFMQMCHLLGYEKCFTQTFLNYEEVHVQGQ